MNREWVSRGSSALLGLLLLVLGGCGGPQRAQPTAIPASVVRPVQPTPRYPGGADVFSLLTPSAAPQFVPTAAAEAALAVTDASGGQQRAAIKLFMEDQTPSATGIAPGGTTIYAERGRRPLATVPSGGVLTVTGKSADGAWYAVYNEDAVFGWVPAGQLRVYGGEDLVVVETAPDPAPVATLLAQAAEPVRVLDSLMVTLAATTAEQRTNPGPNPELTAGVVTSEGRLNLRAAPDTAAAIVRKLDPGAAVTILERNADGAWLRLQLDDGTTGWAAAEYVQEAAR